MPVEALRKQSDARAASAPLYSAMVFVGDALVLGAETRLGLANRSLLLKQDGEAFDGARVAVLLAVACGRLIAPWELVHIRCALEKQSEGQTPLALVHLALANLPKLQPSVEAAWRLSAADELIKRGMGPGELLAALEIGNATAEEVTRTYNPDQLRVPAGSGRPSGRWTKGDGIVDDGVKPPSSRSVQVADNSSNWASYLHDTSASVADAVPGAHYGRLASDALHRGNYSNAAIYEAAALLDAAIAVITLGESTEITAATRAAAQLAANKLAGKAAEEIVESKLVKNGVQFGEELTVVTDSGRKNRFDFVTRDPNTGVVGCIECKASETAPLTTNQTRNFPEVEATGATIVGAGKPGFPGGTRIPPARVEIIRNPKR
jgi:hypothetical protein